MYDPAIGRFTGVDPISDRFAWVSTYNYAENEPIANIDLHGLQKLSFTEILQDYLWGSRSSTGAAQSGRSQERIQENTKLAKSGLNAIEKTAEAYDQTYGAVLPGYSSLNSFGQGNYGEAALLAFLDVGTGGKGKVAKEAVEEGGKTLYRAIGTGELKDIVEKRALDFGPNGAIAKYFTETFDDALQQGIKGPDKDNFLIISINLPKNVLDKLDKEFLDGAFMKNDSYIVVGQEALEQVNKAVDGIKVFGTKSN